MIYTRKLTDPKTNKVWIAQLSDKTVKIESGKPGKTKITEKSFDAHAEVLKQFAKLEWEMLKKGCVLNNPNSHIGEPALHFFVGSGYTGCLPLASTPDTIITNKNGDWKQGGKDALIFATQSGTLEHTVELPKNLPWDIAYSPVCNSFFMDLDHLVFRYQPDTQCFTQLTKEMDMPASFISVEGNRLAYFTHPYLTVKDLKTDEILFCKKVHCELYHGHSLQLCGALSKDGHTLALCIKPGEIQLMEAVTGNIIGGINAEFEMVKQMEFAFGDSILVILEQYGSQRIRFFDIHKKQEIPYLFNDLLSDGSVNLITSFCFNQNQGRLAVLNRQKVQVYDAVKRSFLHTFNIEHMVKTGNIVFIGDKLGVRTDYGCLSLYTV